MTSHASGPRLDYSSLAPNLFKKYLDFAMAFDMDEGLALLVDIRARLPAPPAT